jgi:hypothetical protein
LTVAAFAVGAGVTIDVTTASPATNATTVSNDPHRRPALRVEPPIPAPTFEAGGSACRRRLITQRVILGSLA